MRLRSLTLATLISVSCASSFAEDPSPNDAVYVLSKEIEVGARRVQRFDRDHDDNGSGDKDGKLPASTTRAYVYGRTNTFAAFQRLTALFQSRKPS